MTKRTSYDKVLDPHYEALGDFHKFENEEPLEEPRYYLQSLKCRNKFSGLGDLK